MYFRGVKTKKQHFTIWVHKTIFYDYTSGDDYATVTMLPTGGFWEAQVGWNYVNPIDLTGYTSLVCEFYDVSFDSGDVIFGASSTVSAGINENGDDIYLIETTVFDWMTYTMTLDLTSFTAEQLASISLINFQVTDSETETASLKIKRVYLDGEANSLGQIKQDSDSEFVDVYNITGIKIHSKVKRSEIIQQLPSGLYIVRNKKVFIKK